MGKQANKADLESSADYILVAAGAVDVFAIGLNAGRKSPADKRCARAIMYSGDCTVTDPTGDNNRALPTTTAYTYIPIQYSAIVSADNDVFVIF